MNSACQAFTKKAIVLLTIILSGSLTFSQSPVMIRGIVQNEKGEKLPGVAVTATNAKTKFSAGTNSDSSGIFEFVKLPAGSGYSFSFSSLGYEPLTMSEYTIKPDITLTLAVKLKEQIVLLNQVVITGYTSQRKKDLTGAVSVVNVEEMKTTPGAGFDQALQGRVSGVTIMNSGQPGGGVAVRIRGFSTINNNDPLYIIDGIPVTGSINTLNSADIETIQVLKDASSASIYGARAANGVVIITTKTAKAGKTQLTYDGYAGIQEAANLPKLLNTDQYSKLWFQALKNGGQTIPAGNPYGSGPDPVIPDFLDAAKTTPAGNTDWLKTVFRTSLVHSHTLSFLQGTDRGSTAFNVGYYNQEGILNYTGYKRYSVRFNSDYTFFNRLRIGEFATVTYSETNNTGENAALGTALISSFNADPLLPVYNIYGNFAGPVPNMPITTRNPLSNLNSDKDNMEKRWRVLGKVFAELKMGKGITLSSNYAIDYLGFNGRIFSPTYSEGTQVNSTSSLTVSNSYALISTWSNFMQFKKSFGRHDLDMLVGTEFISRYAESMSAGRQAIPVNDPAAQQLNAGQLTPTNSGTAFRSALFSEFGKINYAYNERFLASFTLRNDATSRLANGYNSQVFPAFSLGWRVSKEPFFARLTPVVNDFKIRYGWGQNGNQEISDYSTFSTFALDLNNTYYDITGSNISSLPGYSQRRIGNPMLRWETTTQSDIGLELGLFRNSLTISMDYYTKKTKDLLVQPQLPSTIGAAIPPYINGGSMLNKGLELELGYRHNAKPFSYSLDGNISFLTNRITALTDELSFIASPVSNTLTRNLELQRSVVGQPISSFYGYKVAGIFKTQAEVDAYPAQAGKAIGRFKYEDINGDKVIDDKDRTFLGSPLPKFSYGFNMRFAYKGVDLWMFFQGASGNKIFEFTRWYTDFFANNSNKSIRLLNAWSLTNPDSDVPMITTSNTNNDTRPSSYFIQNGSYLRFKTIQLGYTFRDNVLGIPGGKMRLYVQAQNLFTITKYTGMDPEVGLQDYGNANRNLDMGVDRGIYPVSRSFLIGFTVKL
ncbi:MAG: TonB-dependent receptor [Sediminibacterium sp.]|nr:TonB-dependent receptor [Sediminibacterium sp.]